MSLPPALLEAFSSRPSTWDRLHTRMLQSRHARWIVPAVVALLAAVLRLWNLGHPDRLAFDETYYVKDAWSLWTQGYEGVWAAEANDDFAQGDTSALSTRGSFIVHPPLGKWVIALGMGLLGQDSSVGWRLTTAILGSLSVLVLYGIALVLTRSITTAAIAGGLMAIDGLGISMSRTALLDSTLGFFVLLGVLFVVLDRRHGIPPVERPGPDGSERHWGRVVWRRPWLLAAGAALGAASAVKWSGLYVLAGLGIYLVVIDALARRRAGITFWPTDAAVRQGPVTFLLLVPAAAVTYLATWTGWFVTEGGYDRGSDDNPLIALWNYHVRMYNFHTGLTKPHSYESPAWEWPLLLRPTAVWVGDSDGVTCWGSDHCIAVITAIPNPLIWYAGGAASIYLLYRFVRGLVNRSPMPVAFALPLVGLAVTWVPWLLYPERTIFFFYTIVMLPFLCLALALVLREIAGRRGAPLHRRQSGQRTVAVFLVVAVLLSAFYYPVVTGITVPYDFWRLHNWSPRWI